MARDIKFQEEERLRGKRRPVLNDLDVFINCPFDDEYKPIFNAIVYTVVRLGYRARCALETSDAAENRLGKIINIVSECRFAVHDISRTETSGTPPLPRFNMPLELGLWMGAKHLGGMKQRQKSCIVFDIDPHRYQRFISDISGQDIASHDGQISVLITKLSAWLRGLPGGRNRGGGAAILKEYQIFDALLPNLCAAQELTINEIEFSDFNTLVSEYVTLLTNAPPAEVAA